MGEISTGAQSVARTPMYALAGNCRFCPADPMKKAPTAVLNSLHHCWGPNWHKTTLKKDSTVPHVGTLADDLSCPVQPPSLVLVLVLSCTSTVCEKLRIRENSNPSTRTERQINTVRVTRKECKSVSKENRKKTKRD